MNDFAILKTTFGTMCQMQLDGTICIKGDFDGRNHRHFISGLRSPMWLDISPTTKIILKDFMIQESDTKFGGDIWGAKWFVDWFGSSVTFVDCVVVELGLGKFSYCLRSAIDEHEQIFEWIRNFDIEWLNTIKVSDT